MKVAKMERNLTALYLILKELEVPISIRSVSDRLLIQKAIFLTQALGRVPLGYRYSWYVRGPYSPPLTRDYYALEAELLQKPLSENAPLQFREDVLHSLSKVRGFLRPPEDINLSSIDWAELLASVVYLGQEEKLDAVDIRERLKHTKPWLSNYTDWAFDALKTENFAFTQS